MRLYLLYLSTRYLAPALPSTCGSTYNTFCKVHIPRVYHIATWLGSSTVGLVLTVLAKKSSRFYVVLQYKNVKFFWPVL